MHMQTQRLFFIVLTAILIGCGTSKRNYRANQQP